MLIPIREFAPHPTMETVWTKAFNDFKNVALVASAEIKFVDAITVGVDLGYGISLESNIDADLVYRFQS